MKKYIFLAAFALIFTTACADKPQPPQGAPAAAKSALTAYAGTYSGILPCADCEGIDTELTLNPDNTFTLIEFYLSQESDLYLTEGAWKLSADLTHATLIPAEEAGRAQQPLYYKLNANGIDLDKLDIHAKPIVSSFNYTLRRK